MASRECKIGGIIFTLCVILSAVVLVFAPKDGPNTLHVYTYQAGKKSVDVQHELNTNKTSLGEPSDSDEAQHRNFRLLPNGMVDLRVRPDHIKLLKNSNESFAFYVIAGWKQNLKQDLRSKFWEFQLEHFGGKADIVYMSDGPLNVNGVEYQILPPERANTTFEDRQFCIRSPATFDHFVQHFPNHRWYFRGTHDTFVNMTGLILLTQELEAKFGDPMTTFSAAFNCHEWNHIMYPQGGTGWLFSNAAMREFQAKNDRFIWYCRGSFDDVALANFMAELQHPVETFRSNKFIVTWPNTEGEVIFKEKWAKQVKCPAKYYLWPEAPGFEPCPVTSAVSIHMHKVPMGEAWEQLLRVPDGIAVYFQNPDTPMFCRL